jgi:hypothetical protein
VGVVLRGHLVALRDLGLLVGVDLGEGEDVRTGQLAGELLVERSDRLARRAPVGVDYFASVPAHPLRPESRARVRGC